MTWLGTELEDTDRAWWGLRFPFGGGLVRNFPGEWPHPDTDRTDSRFRMLHGLNQVPAAIRWFVFYRILSDGFTPTLLWEGYGFVDLTATAGGHVQGSLPPDVNGFSYEMEILNWEDLPGGHGPGVTIRYVLTSPGGLKFGWENQYDADTQFAFKAYKDATFGSQSRSNYVGDPTWPWQNTGLWFAAVADCFSFPPEPTVGAGFAAMNGTDAYIHMTPATEPISTRWLISGELFLRSATYVWLLTFSTNSLSICGFTNGTAWWRSNNGSISPALPIGEWFEFEYEREWLFPTGNQFRLRVNGVQVASFGGTNFAIPFDEIGRRAAASPPQYGDFDLRNFKVQEGSPETPLVRLDMPLEINACDQGPVAASGETFNMDLLSCP